jgi:transposase
VIDASRSRLTAACASRSINVPNRSSAAAAAFSIIASCRLHRIDPYQYLEEILRVLPYWPRDRHLELAPKYWHATRGRLRPEELAGPLSAFEVPPPLREIAEPSAASNA